jgi:endonuclease-3
MARPRTPAGRTRETDERLQHEYPGDAKELCELDFETPFQLLTATILSAQTTDVRVNMATPGLFAKFPDAPSLAAADPGEVEVLIQSTGFYRNKTKSIIGMARAVVDDFGGELPHRMDDLVKLPGVGRKTANVLLSVAMDAPGLPVDTHVTRLSQRLGLTEKTDAVKIESDLCAALKPSQWGGFSLRLILHGRRVCVARTPKCAECVLNDFCPSAQVVATKSKKAAAKEA